MKHTTTVQADWVHAISDIVETPPLLLSDDQNASLDVGDCIHPPHLPSFVAKILRERGVRTLHEWQRECLHGTTCLDGRTSLLYALPTSGGKTLVAELVLLRALLVARKSAIMILPFVSLVTEKMRWLQTFVEAAEANDAPFSLEGLYQNQGKLPDRQSIGDTMPTLYMATMEKANLLINALFEQGALNAETIGCVVIDEMHMMDDAYRGYLLEWMVTKMRFATAAQVVPSLSNIPLIAMSATMPNLNHVARWMDATAYCRNFRPVPLHEYVINGRDLLQVVRTKRHPNTAQYMATTFVDRIAGYYAPQKIGHWLWHHSNYTTPMRRNPHVARATLLTAFDLTYQIAPFQSTLLFCASRAATRDLALELTHLLSCAPAHTYASYMDDLARVPNIQPYLMKDGDATPSIFQYTPSTTFENEAVFDEAMRQIREARERLARQLETGVDTSNEPSPADHHRNGALARCVRQGVAWHNADLSTRERALIEDAYRAQVLFAICATSTLAAGVNLPARRVILLSPKMGNQSLSVRDYRQMVGRAGRAGLCEMGESFLIIPPALQAHVPPPPPSTPSSLLKFYDTHVEPYTGWCAWRAIQLAARPLEPVRSALLQRDDATREAFMRLRQLNLYWHSHARLHLQQEFDQEVVDRALHKDEANIVTINMIDAKAPIFSRFCMNERAVTVGAIAKPVLVSGTHLERLALEWIASGMCVERDAMQRWMRMSWHADSSKSTLQQRKDDEMITQRLQGALDFLQHVGMIEMADCANSTNNEYRTTPFGEATYKSPFALHVAIHTHETIERMAHIVRVSVEGKSDYDEDEREAFLQSQLVHMACWLSVPPCNASLEKFYPTVQTTDVAWSPQVRDALDGEYLDKYARMMGVETWLFDNATHDQLEHDGNAHRTTTPRYRRVQQLQEQPGWAATLHCVLSVIVLRFVTQPQQQQQQEESTTAFVQRLADQFDLAVGDVEYLVQASVQHAHYLSAFVNRNAWSVTCSDSPLFTHSNVNLPTMLALIETRLQGVLNGDNTHHASMSVS